MKVGGLYQFNELYWYLYPSKDIGVIVGDILDCAAHVEKTAHYYSGYWSRRSSCRVSYLEPTNIFCLLERADKFCKVLTTNGKLGWIVLADWCRNDIEEVKENS